MEIPKLDYKKILLLIGFVILSLGLGFLVFWVFFLQGNTPEPTPPGTVVTPGGQLPGAGGSGTGSGGAFPVTPGTETPGATAPTISNVAQGGLTNVLPLNTSRVVDPTVTRDGSGVAFYEPETGKFYRLSSDGKTKTLLTDEVFFAVQSVSWSADKNKAVLEFPDGANIIYDFTTRSSVTLPQQTVDHKFAESSDNLAFKIETDNPDDNWLVITNSQGGNPKFIEPVGNRGALVDVGFSPNEEVVAVYHEPIGAGKEEVYFLGQSGENFKSFIVEGLNFQGKYSPDGQRMLYHVMSPADSYNPSLWIVDVGGIATGLNKFPLNLETWVDKCTFSQNNRIVYCAVPRSLEAGTGLAVGSESITKDDFYSINLDTGIKTLIARPATTDGQIDVAVTDMWLDDNEQYLFFWDARSGGTYRLQLK